jgi:hypothetical protein
MVAFALEHGTARVRRPCAQVHPSTRAHPSGDKAGPWAPFRASPCSPRRRRARDGRGAVIVERAHGRQKETRRILGHPKHHAVHPSRTHRPTAGAALTAAHGVEPGSAVTPPRRPVAIPIPRSGLSSLTRVRTPTHAVPLRTAAPCASWVPAPSPRRHRAEAGDGRAQRPPSPSSRPPSPATGGSPRRHTSLTSRSSRRGVRRRQGRPVPLFLSRAIP